MGEVRGVCTTAGNLNALHVLENNMEMPKEQTNKLSQNYKMIQ